MKSTIVVVVIDRNTAVTAIAKMEMALIEITIISLQYSAKIIIIIIASVIHPIELLGTTQINQKNSTAKKVHLLYNYAILITMFLLFS